ncbi:hypothetical protein MRX96_045536 [Rhipicephalus microplus]
MEFYRSWVLQWPHEYTNTALCKWVPGPREFPDYFPPNQALVTLLVAHGRFHSYFHRFNMLRNLRCFCGIPSDSVQHNLSGCPATRTSCGTVAPQRAAMSCCLETPGAQDSPATTPVQAGMWDQHITFFRVPPS